MTTKYEVFDTDGKRHTRTTKGRTYTHCVVFHIPAYGPDQYGHVWPAHDKASWAGSLTLAQKRAAEAHSEVAVEILSAREI